MVAKIINFITQVAQLMFCFKRVWTIFVWVLEIFETNWKWSLEENVRFFLINIIFNYSGNAAYFCTTTLLNTEWKLDIVSSEKMFKSPQQREADWRTRDPEFTDSAAPGFTPGTVWRSRGRNPHLHTRAQSL